MAPERPPFLQSLGVMVTALGTVVSVLAAVGLMALLSHQMQGDPRVMQCAWLLGGGVVAIVGGLLMKRAATRKSA